MIRIIKCLVLAMLLSALCSAKAHAQTINAASCSSSAVQAALNSVAADGTTVTIPAGTCTWTTAVSYTASHNSTIMGQTTITGSCGPANSGATCVAADNTNIQVATSTGIGGPPALTIHTVAGKSVRVTGISFMWASGVQQYAGMLHIDGATNNFRVDHCHFWHANIYDFQIVGNVGPLTGVVDHNLFNAIVGNEFALSMQHSNWSGNEPSTTPTYPNGVGNSSWSAPSNWGSSQFIFYENNWFVWDGPSTGHGFAYDCPAAGARIVFRYNQVGPHMMLQTHGTGSGDANYRSCRGEEIYGNNLVYDPAPNGSNTSTYSSQMLMLEGGGLFLWNNNISGFQNMVEMDYMRSNSATYSQSATPGGWGYCSASQMNGIAGPSVWDQNISGEAGGPCVDQTGRGQGDLVTGTFPSKVNSRTGTQTWLNQASDPAYVWGNTFATFPNITLYYWSNYASGSVGQDRDYFLETPRLGSNATFNGTSGVGCGPFSGVGCTNPVAQPATCTQGTGYWNPATNTLYQCGSSNNWAAYYTPYIYPHPLTLGSGTPPAPPTGLQAIVN